MSKVTYTPQIWGGPLPASNITISSTASSSGSGDYIKFVTGSQQGRMLIDGNGYSTFGASSNILVDFTNSRIQTVTSGDWQISCVQYGNNAGGAGYALAKTRSASADGQTALVNNDEIGFYFAAGSDGSNFIPAASLSFQVDGAVSANTVPTRLCFQTGSHDYGTERFRLDSVGRVGIGMTPVDPNVTGAGGTDRLSVRDPDVGSSYFSVATYNTGSGNGNANACLSVNNYNNDGYGDGLDIIYAGGTASNPSHLAAETEHGLVNFKTWLTGTTYGALACVQAFTEDSTHTSTSCPGRLIFGTTPTGAVDTTERMRIDRNGNVIVNTAAIATNATDGFLYVPTCAGTPTGTPTTYTGRAPVVVDTTNNRIYFYSSGAWRNAGP